MIDVQYLLSSIKDEITQVLRAYLLNQERVYHQFPLDYQLLSHLRDYTVSGKMYRGCLLILLYEALVHKPNHEAAVKAAAALELLEAGILMQDDVMDQDELRRGRPSIHMTFGATPGIREEVRKRFGESVALCLGDAAYFLAYELLGTLAVPDRTKIQLTALYSSEMTRVTLAQVEDMRLGGTVDPVTETQILAMYQRKTSTYTWVLPLLAGAAFADKLDTYREPLERIGNAAGLVYQLIDDTIGMFGDEKTIGKPVGSDIREGKKTVFWHYASMHLSGSDKKQFDALYGNSSVTPQDIDRVKTLIEQSGAKTYVESLISTYQATIYRELDNGNFPKRAVTFLRQLVDYISARKR